MKADLFLISTCSISTWSTIKSLSCFDFCVFLFHLLVWFLKMSGLVCSSLKSLLFSVVCHVSIQPYLGLENNSF